MGAVRTLRVAADEEGVRLDRWLRRRWPHLGQTQIHKLARSGQIRVDGGRAKADTRLSAGAMVRVPPLPEAPPTSASLDLTDRDRAFVRSLVLFEDDEVLVLDKPAGLAVQGGTKTSRHIDRLLGAWGEGVSRPRLTHRLDRDTSGVMVLGKSASAAARLAAAFAGREAEKTYWAIVEGHPRPATGVIDLPLAKNGVADFERVSPVHADDPNAKPALSEYVTLARSGPGASARVAWLALRPLTGRTHQLRAHLLSLGHPILGDHKYGTPESRAASGGLELQLHARRLTLPHPSGGLIDMEAPPGSRIQAGFDRFGFDAGRAPRDPFSRRPGR